MSYNNQCKIEDKWILNRTHNWEIIADTMLKQCLYCKKIGFMSENMEESDIMLSGEDIPSVDKEVRSPKVDGKTSIPITPKSENTAEKIEQLIKKEVNECFRNTIVNPRKQSDILLNHALYHRIDALVLFYSKFFNIAFVEACKKLNINYGSLQKLNPKEFIGN